MLAATTLLAGARRRSARPSDRHRLDQGLRRCPRPGPTRFAHNALPEYPRPQLTRTHWQNLNGVWEFAGAAAGEAPPFGHDLAERVLVPFPIESALSGIQRHEDRMWYRRTFTVPAELAGRCRPAAAAELRRGRLRRDGVGQRHPGRHAPRRLRRVQCRRHRCADAAAARRSSIVGVDGPDRQQPGSRSASSATSPTAASSTPPARASGRRSGWSRSRPPASSALDMTPDIDGQHPEPDRQDRAREPA